MNVSYGAEPIERTSLQSHTKRGRGRTIYLPQKVLEAAWGGPLPPDVWASRIVFEPGTRQILIRLTAEP